MADQAKGGLGNNPTARCIPGGMPRMMAAPRMEYIITLTRPTLWGMPMICSTFAEVFHRRARLAQG